MVELIVDVLGGVVLFVGGLLVGAHNYVSVDKAIASLKAAEASAQSTLTKITTHKAS